jgi:uncharacterized protein YciI
MHFLILAHDGTDADAPARRQRVRETHLERAKSAKMAGTIIFGGAILDDAEQMVGSALLVDMPTMADAESWIAEDPYVLGEVWQDVSVMPFRLASL